MNNIKCIFCYTNQTKEKSYIFKLKFNNKEYHYYKCNSCKIYFVHPIPSKEDLNNIYNQNYYSSFYMKKTDEDEEFKRFYNKIKKYINLNDIILDYGCGDGKFLKLLTNKNYKIFGTDLPSKMLENLTENKLNIVPLNKLLKIKKEFKVIYLRDVFEHSHEPVKLIKNLEQLLLDNGYLIIDGPVEKNFSLINYLIILNYKIKKTFRNNLFENAPYHLSLFSKNQLINFLSSTTISLKIVDLELYETGWPLQGNGLVKNLIAKMSIFFSKIFYLRKFYGNRMILILKKNEKN